MSDTTSPPFGTGTSSDSGASAVQEKAQQAAGQAKEQVQQAAGQAQGRARDLVDQRSTEAGQRIGQEAGDLRTVSESLREQGKDGPARIADQAAERVEKVGSWLERSDADQLLRDVEDFSRRQPWAVALGGLALGFAASRFLKASSQERYSQSGPQARSLSTGYATPTGSGGGNGLSAPAMPDPSTAPATEWPAPPTTPGSGGGF